MKLGWYINRLRSMEPAEIVHRLAENRRRAVSRSRDQGWARYPEQTLHPVFSSWQNSVLGANEDQRAVIAKAATATLEGRFSALGRDWPKRDEAQLFPAAIWRLDPVTSTLWPGPDVYTHDIDFRDGGGRGDIKYVWEFNRLQVLPTLAAHLLLTGETRAKSAIEAAIVSWHAANPPFGGVGWASGIEVALRAVSLIATLDIAQHHISEQARGLASQILVASLYWLKRFPSLFSSANNHLVAELAGEHLIGLALHLDTASQRQALVDELQKQILADGAGAEQTPTYAAFTAELVLLSAAAGAEAGFPFPVEATERLAAFADFAGWLPSQGPFFGDDDEGRAITSGKEEDYVQSVAAAIDGFLGRPGYPAQPGDFRGLLLGAPVQTSASAVGLRTFSDGGLTVWRGELRGRQVELMLDHGPLGYLSIAAHGHADSLALSLWIDGEPILVDPGTYLYGSGGVWRDWFRSTPAHNTLNIDGKSQSVMSGKFNWAHKAATALNKATPEPDWSIEAEHDGYHARYGVMHRRTISRDGQDVVIADRLIGGPRAAEIVFQLAQGLTVRQAGKLLVVHRGDEALLSIQYPDGAIQIKAGGASPGEGGWVSTRFGSRQPAERIAWRGAVGEEGVSFRLSITARKHQNSRGLD